MYIYTSHIWFENISDLHVPKAVAPVVLFWLKQKKWYKCTLNFFWWMFEGRGSKNAGACIQKFYCLITLKGQRWGWGGKENRAFFFFKLSSVILVYHCHRLPKVTNWNCNIQYNQLPILNKLTMCNTHYFTYACYLKQWLTMCNTHYFT